MTAGLELGIFTSEDDKTLDFIVRAAYSYYSGGGCFLRQGDNFKDTEPGLCVKGWEQLQLY